VPALRLGETGGPALEVSGLFAVPLDELRDVHRRALPALFG
jgi:phosphoribosylformylglycinamidine synthase